MLRSDRRMLKYIAGVSLRDGISSEEVLRRCGLRCILKVLHGRRLGWFGDVVRRAEGGGRLLAELREVDQGRPGEAAWRIC